MWLPTCQTGQKQKWWRDFDVYKRSFRVLLQSGPYDLEYLSVLLFSNSQSSNTSVSLFYRPPSSTVSIFDHLFYTLQLLNPFYFSTFLLLGDFNVNKTHAW